MNKYRKLFYSSAVALPMLALAATSVHAASTGNLGMVKFSPAKALEFKNIELTAEQKTAVEQAKALYEQADAILEKAGLPARHPMMGKAIKMELTDEQKATMEQVRKLHEEGKHDEAKALIEKAGFPAGGAPHMMRFKRMELKDGQAVPVSGEAGDFIFSTAPVQIEEVK